MVTVSINNLLKAFSKDLNSSVTNMGRYCYPINAAVNSVGRFGSLSRVPKTRFILEVPREIWQTIVWGLW